LEGSSLDNGTILLRESSSCMDVLEVLALGMTGSGRGGDLAKAYLNSWSSVDAVGLSVVSHLSLL
jgi:hypothetical protein